MGIFLRQSYNIPPSRWGSPADVQYAVKVNSEKIYNRQYENIILALPLFWGLPFLDYSENNNKGLGSDVIYKNRNLYFNNNAYLQVNNTPSLNPSYLTIYSGIQPSDPGVIDQICSKDARGVQRVWQFRKNASNVLEFIVFNDPSGNSVVAGTTSVVDGISHNVVGTWDGSNIKVYVDGELDGNPVNYAGVLYSSATNDVFVGLAQTIDQGAWHGYIEYTLLIKEADNVSQIALQNDLPYGLYQKVSRPVYLLPTTPSVGWTGKIITRTNPTKILGRATSGISKVIGI